ncbi:MAG TPA: hypothetical protein VNJ05_03235, partial [Sphingomicrobium sp.]|nr:hypothetical protein [Sphingomicrobium sp.]
TAVSLTGMEPAAAAPMVRASTPAADDFVPASGHALVAPTVAMPAAEMLLAVAGPAEATGPAVGAMVVELLAGDPPTIDALLSGLPGSAAVPDATTAVKSQEWADWLAVEAALPAMDAPAFHPDVAAVA